MEEQYYMSLILDHQEESGSNLSATTSTLTSIYWTLLDNKEQREKESYLLVASAKQRAPRWVTKELEFSSLDNGRRLKCGARRRL